MRLLKKDFKKSVKKKFKSKKNIKEKLKEMFWSDFGQYGGKMDFVLQSIPIRNIKYTETGQDKTKISRLKSSIKKDGFYAPIIVDENFLKNGHHRFFALKDLGFSNIIAFVPKEYNSDGGKILNFNDWF